MSSNGEPEPELDSYLSSISFMTPDTIVLSAWHEHLPFAFWTVSELKPRRIVELGTHNGLSFFGFCQAVAATALACEVVAVDTWQGDEHAGEYSGEVYDFVRETTDATYPDFTKLLRMTFDEALAEVPDSSVDLLHIDGRHFEEDVRHDFETWLPKLSDRAVVLFHDTQVRERGFGVYRYWAQLQQRYPTFEFHHGHGLGVLLAGQDVPEGFSEFIANTTDGQFAESVRQAYSQLGRGASMPFHRERWQRAESESRQLQKTVDHQARRIAQLEEQAETDQKRRSDLRNLLEESRAETDSLRQSLWWRAGKPVRSASSTLRSMRKGGASR